MSVSIALKVLKINGYQVNFFDVSNFDGVSDSKYQGSVSIGPIPGYGPQQFYLMDLEYGGGGWIKAYREALIKLAS